MSFLLALIVLATEPAHAEDLRFRGTLVEDRGFWRSGRVTLTERALIVRTRTFPFRVDTAGYDIGRYPGDFVVRRGLIRGTITIHTARQGDVEVRCSARQARRVAAELEQRLIDAR